MTFTMVLLIQMSFGLGDQQQQIKTFSKMRSIEEVKALNAILFAEIVISLHGHLDTSLHSVVQRDILPSPNEMILFVYTQFTSNVQVC